jgi:hypothetical protein
MDKVWPYECSCLLCANGCSHVDGTGTSYMHLARASTAMLHLFSLYATVSDEANTEPMCFRSQHEYMTKLCRCPQSTFRISVLFYVFSFFLIWFFFGI